MVAPCCGTARADKIRPECGVCPGTSPEPVPGKPPNQFVPPGPPGMGARHTPPELICFCTSSRGGEKEINK